jgi:hypothetical protein
MKEHEIDGSLTEVAEPERQVGGVGLFPGGVVQITVPSLNCWSRQPRNV